VSRAFPHDEPGVDSGPTLCDFADGIPETGEVPHGCQRIGETTMQHFDDPDDRPFCCNRCAAALLASGDYSYASRDRRAAAADAREHERGRCGGLAQGCSACNAEALAQDGRL